jgi:hypothetical protein
LRGIVLVGKNGALVVDVSRLGTEGGFPSAGGFTGKFGYIHSSVGA